MKLGHALLLAVVTAAVAAPAASAVADAGGAGNASTSAFDGFETDFPVASTSVASDFVRTAPQEVRDALAGRSSAPGSAADRTPSQQAAPHAKPGAPGSASADAEGGFEWATVAVVVGVTALAMIVVASVVVRHSATRHPPTGPPTVAAH